MTAFTAAMAMAAGSLLVGADTASAATAVSQAQGRFLSGSALSTNLDTFAELAGAAATNDGTTANTVDNHPLDATVLNAVQAGLGSGLHLFGDNGLITFGAGNQYAAASSSGSSAAASGAVDNSGAIAIGGQNGVPNSDATVDLGKLLGSPAGPGLTVLSGGTLQVGAVSATATETAGGAQSGAYQVASLQLDLASPLITDLTNSLTTVNLTASLGALVPGGVIANIPNLSDILAGIGPVTSLDGSIVFDIRTGAVSIDVAKVLTAAGLDLNDLPPNTQLIPVVVAALATQLVPAITTAVNGLVTQIGTAISGITASVPILGTALPIGPALATLTDEVITPLTDALGNLRMTAVTPIGNTLTRLLSLTGNGQSTAAGTFTQTALRVILMPAVTPLATVNLASAAVGANEAASTPPTSVSLAPHRGPVTGGTAVVVTGTGFVQGATSISIGGNTVAAADVTVNSAGTTATFSTPGHPAGPVGVTVTTGSTRAPALDFFYDALTADSVTPTHGPTVGGTSVTVDGSGFVPGATTVSIGGTTIPAASVTVDPTGTTARFTTPTHGGGPVQLTLTTAAGTTAPLTYTFVPGAPTGISLSPNQGPAAGGTPVTVTGRGFVTGQTSVTIGGIAVPASAVTVTSDTSLHFTTPAHAAGPVGVTITTASGTTTPPLSFFYSSATCVLTGENAATVTVFAPVGSDTALVGSTFSVTAGGRPAGIATPVIPAAGGILQVQASVPVPANTTSVAYTLAATDGSYTTIVGSPIACTPLDAGQREAGIYHPLQSARLLDTRKSVPLNPGATYTLQVLGHGGVPATKVASLVANVTVTEPARTGFLTVYPDGSRPNTSSVNFAPAQTVANLMTAPVGADGKIRIFNGSSGTTHVLVDVSGYFSSGDTVAPGSYNRLNPVRILDTNRSVGVPTSTPVPANGVLTLRVTGVGGIQATNVSAVALNLTVDQTTRNGYVTVFKSGAAPNVSSLNFLKGQTDANLVIAPVAADGTIKIRNTSQGTVRLIADVSGYFLGGVAILDGEFVAVNPGRVLDTRPVAPVQPLATIGATMLGRNGIPLTGVSAVVLNVTVDRTTGLGFITVFPHDPKPNASNLNFVAGAPRPNSVIAPLGSDGKVRMFNGSQRPVDLIADVSGYFISNPVG